MRICTATSLSKAFSDKGVLSMTLSFEKDTTSTITARVRGGEGLYTITLSKGGVIESNRTGVFTGLVDGTYTVEAKDHISTITDTIVVS